MPEPVISCMKTTDLYHDYRKIRLRPAKLPEARRGQGLTGHLHQGEIWERLVNFPGLSLANASNDTDQLRAAPPVLKFLPQALEIDGGRHLPIYDAANVSEHIGRSVVFLMSKYCTTG